MSWKKHAISALALPLALLLAAPPVAAGWDETLAEARGQTVYWNAWGGDQRINDYIAWVGERVAADYGVELVQVKLTDTADAVGRVLAEKQAGRDDDGSIDLVWINGENFAAMKEAGLLFGPFVDGLPANALVDYAAKPTNAIDFTVPTEGYEAPWGLSRLSFIYDSATVAEPPASFAALVDWAETHPGRFTYPAPPDFMGSTFLKQALLSLTEDRAELLRPIVDDAQVERVTAPLWATLERLHPALWRQGRLFPASGPAERQLLQDAEIDITLSFHSGEAASAAAEGLLPESVRVFGLDEGTIANSHFVAIPYNARAKAGAQVVANFLLTPEAQARKQDPAYWGDDTVLDLARLAPAEKALFDAIPQAPQSPDLAALGPALPEPHPSWMVAIEESWRARYAR